MTLTGISDSLIANLICCAAAKIWSGFNDPLISAIEETSIYFSRQGVEFRADLLISMLKGGEAETEIQKFKDGEASVDGDKLALVFADMGGVYFEDAQRTLEVSRDIFRHFKQVFMRNLLKNSQTSATTLASLQQIHRHLSQSEHAVISCQVDELKEMIKALEQQLIQSRVESSLPPEVFDKIQNAFRVYNQGPEISKLRYVGFRLARKEPPALNLLDVFVPLQVQAFQRENPQSDKIRKNDCDFNQVIQRDVPFSRFELEERKTETHEFSDLFSNRRHMVVLGDPGSGKTTLLRWLTLISAQGAQGLQNRLHVNEDLLALPVSVGQLAAIRKKLGNSASVIDVMAHYFHGRNIGSVEDLSQFIRMNLDDGLCLLLLDGLDEVKTDERQLMQNWLESFAAQYANNRLVVTSRHVGYAGFSLPGKGAELSVLPFDDPQVKRYVEAFSKSYFQWETRDLESDLWQEESNKMLQVLDESPRLKSLARNPFMLSGMALIQRAEGRLPRHRVQFYEIFARCLCETWGAARCLAASSAQCDIGFEEEAIPILGSLAIQMTRQYPNGRAPKEFVLESLSKSLQELKSVSSRDAWRAAEKFLERTSEQVQLFLERGPGEWGFLHLTFQEYFAAAGLHNLEIFEAEALDHLFDPNWEEIIRLGLGYMAMIQSRGVAARKFIARIMSFTYPKQPWVTDILRLHIPMCVLLACEAGNVLSEETQHQIADQFLEWAFQDNLYGKISNRIFNEIALTDFGELIAEKLIHALKDEEGAVRSRAAWALGEIKSERAVDALLSALKDPDKDVRLYAASALGEIKSERAVDALLSALKDPYIYVRSSAVSALREIKSERSVDALLSALKDPDKDVRFRAAWALGEIKSERSVDALLSALKDPETDVRFSATLALGKIKSERAVDALLSALKDPETDVRFSATLALGKIKIDRAVDALLSALKDPETDVRFSATSALGGIKSERAVDALLLALKDPDNDVRSSAASALGGIKSERAVDALLSALKDPDNDVRSSAASALGGIKSERAVDALLAALKDADWNWNMCIRAAEALGKIGGERSVDALLAALKDTDMDVRLRAAEALGQIGSERSVDALLAALKGPDWNLRLRAAEALGQIGSERSVDALLAALKDTNMDVRLRAAQALGQIGSERSVDALLAALKDPDKYVRFCAAEALLKFVK